MAQQPAEIATLAALEDDPLWYKDAIIYQLHVKAFMDSDGDGIGDFKGLSQKLDYLQSLGVTAIWLLPFYPSPLRDDGYDISEYCDIHPSYGNLKDFKAFLRAAHHRGLRVITELVINHTSDQHDWFQQARKAPAGSSRRNFYVWSDTWVKYQEARIIFQDFETSNWSWDSTADAYYWHRFYSHQPDLNFDNPQVHKAVLRVLDFWLKIGVDGLRLDAVPYLYEREGTNCENLPETHAFLKKLRAHIDARFRNRMLLCEANQWPEDATVYFGDGDEGHMNFHFPLMPRLFMALRMEDSFPVIDILDQTPDIPDVCQWAIFLRNHDELTLEMVTDEERDYMYRVYADNPQMRLNLGIRRRLAPLLANNRRRIELMNGLLLSLPGTPVIYYGDEIGMGDNIFLGDRNGVRTPMQWSPDRNAGFSRANPQQLYLPIIVNPEFHFEVISVESQDSNHHSLLWWMRRMISLRKRFKAFSRGTLTFLHPENQTILAFVRSHEDQNLLVVANLSRFVQFVELDLSAFVKTTPVEMFGLTEFPPIDKSPYPLTIGPHSFYWFYLQPASVRTEADRTIPETAGEPPLFECMASWHEVLADRGRSRFEKVLSAYVRSKRWFGGKARQIKQARIQEWFPLPDDRQDTVFLFLQVDYVGSESETYVLPLIYVPARLALELIHERPETVVGRIKFLQKAEEGFLLDAPAEMGFCNNLLKMIEQRRHGRRRFGEIIARPTAALQQILKPPFETLAPSIMRAEQSNTSILYGDRLILKLFRRLQAGVNPDLQIGHYLTEKGFAHIPPVAGFIEYRSPQGTPKTLALLQGYVVNQGDAWEYTLNILDRYFEQIIARGIARENAPVLRAGLLQLIDADPPAEVVELADFYPASVRTLAKRTAQMHQVLAEASADPDFAPERFTKLYQRSLYQSMRTICRRNLSLLRRRLNHLPEDTRPEAIALADQESAILETFRRLLDIRITALRTRVHGDYHLGQVLYTGKDFVIIDFEGEPARPVSERVIKRSPLRDVAGMLRSFHYAAMTALQATESRGWVQPENKVALASWADYWFKWMGAIFLKEYLSVVGENAFLPSNADEVQVLLESYLLEKAIYELGYELNNRPDWVRIPITGILHVMGSIET
ncbi:MAG: maltose alpha-D-glucosyltransferase [Desulfobacterales bacterium]